MEEKQEFKKTKFMIKILRWRTWIF